jgi:uncharacterized protein YuzE
MKIAYASDVDTAYIYLVDAIGPGDVKRTYLCDPLRAPGMVSLDFNDVEQLIGIEIVGARDLIQPRLLESAEALPTGPPRAALRMWELVFRHPSGTEEVKTIQAESLEIGEEFRGLDGITWVIVENAGPSGREGHGLKLICVPRSGS